MNELMAKEVNLIIEKAVEKADEINIPMSITVMDAGANIKGFLRMDNAILGSADVAMKKAKTASLFKMNTEELGKLSQPGLSLYGVEHSNGGIITFAGGIPIVKDGVVVGAIGVSGGSTEDDHNVAQAGMQSVK